MSSFFVRVLKRQLRKGKEQIIDLNDREGLESLRETLRKMFSLMRKTGSVEIRQIQIGSVPALQHRLKKPKVSDPMTMLHLHGGGFFSGSAEMYAGFVSDLCKRLQVHAYSISYRLIPEHPYPAALDDAFSSYKWLLDEKKIPAEKIFILGDSVGGGLALALLQRIKKDRLPKPGCAVCISPWTDLTLSNYSYLTNRETDVFFNFTNLKNTARIYAGEDSEKNPEISPSFGEFSDFPPVFFQAESTEMLFDDSMVVAEKMREQGVQAAVDVWEGMFHDFPIFGTMPLIGRFSPEFRQAVNNIKQFVESL